MWLLPRGSCSFEPQAEEGRYWRDHCCLYHYAGSDKRIQCVHIERSIRTTATPESSGSDSRSIYYGLDKHKPEVSNARTQIYLELVSVKIAISVGHIHDWNSCRGGKLLFEHLPDCPETDYLKICVENVKVRIIIGIVRASDMNYHGFRPDFIFSHAVSRLFARTTCWMISLIQSLWKYVVAGSSTTPTIESKCVLLNVPFCCPTE